MVVAAGAGWVVVGCIQLGMLEHAVRLNPQAAIAMACFMTCTPAAAARDRVRVEAAGIGELRIGVPMAARHRGNRHTRREQPPTRQFAPIKINEDLTWLFAGDFPILDTGQAGSTAKPAARSLTAA
jgi:hypothetical protein